MNTALYRIPDLPPKEEGKRGAIIPNQIKNHTYDGLSKMYDGTRYADTLAAPKDLESLGAALTDLINLDETSKLKSSSDALSASLQAVPSSPIGKAAGQAVSDLSQKIGGLFVERIKADAVRSLMNTTSGAIGELCTKIGTDFMTTVDATTETPPSLYVVEFELQANTLRTSAESGMIDNPKDVTGRSDSYDGYILAQQNIAAVHSVFPKIVKASADCVTAKKALNDALADNSASLADIQAFYTSVKSLVSDVSALQPTSK